MTLLSTPSRWKSPLKVLFVASEAFPLAKSGGLADVVAALPRALSRAGVDVRVMLPAYPQAIDLLAEPRVVARLNGDPFEGQILAGAMPDTGLPVYLYDAPTLFRRTGTLYQDADGGDWVDNHLRYGGFCRAAADLALGNTAITWRPDLVHAHDWHAALVPALLALTGQTAPRSLLTIHNMAFQGNFSLAAVRGLDLPDELARSAEFYGQFSYLKAGLCYSDRVSTVSPTYAKEIFTPEFGCGLDGVLRSRADDLIGILNGVDYEIWDPAIDQALPHRYDADDVDGKAACKSAGQDALGLERSEKPLVAYINRLTHQKMADVVLKALPRIIAEGAQFVLHGQGDKSLEAAFVAAGQEHGGDVAIRIGYDEETARRITAAADVTLTPSRFEPCGLTTMYGMRYGALPVTRRVGGLADTVVDADNQEGAPATGFAFVDESPDSMADCVGRAVARYRHDDWQQLRRSAMRRDFSWERSAQRYLEVYTDLARMPGMNGHLRAA